MRQILPVISGKEQVLFDLLCCVNELHALKHELSILDIDQIEKSLKKLHSSLHERQRQPNQIYQLSI